VLVDQAIKVEICFTDGLVIGVSLVSKYSPSDSIKKKKSWFEFLGISIDEWISISGISEKKNI